MTSSWESVVNERVLRADMVEDAVEHEEDAALLARGNEGVEHLLAAEARVDAQVVDGVVAVAGRGEDRPELEPVGAEADRIVEPGDQGAGGRRLVGVCQLVEVVSRRPDRGTHETERVDVPPDGVVEKRHPVILPALHPHSALLADTLRWPGSQG